MHFRPHRAYVHMALDIILIINRLPTPPIYSIRLRVGLNTFFFRPSNFVACHQASATSVITREKLNSNDQPRYVDCGPTRKAARFNCFELLLCSTSFVESCVSYNIFRRHTTR